MKRMVCLLMTLVLLLCSCGQTGSIEGEENSAPTWQEQYDLGVRYLSEGNYQEAILAFAAAIEIDPKRSSAYSGLAEAYVGMGDLDSALDTLQRGIDETEDRTLSELLENYQAQAETESDRFAQNPFYVSNEQLLPEHRAAIENVISAFRSQDTQSLMALIQDPAFLAIADDAAAAYNMDIYGPTGDDQENMGHIRVWVDDVKIQFEVYPMGTSSEFVGIQIELREENGLALHCLLDPPPRQWICWGSTKSWNWEGPYEENFTSDEQIARTTGIAVDGVKHGEEHRQFGQPGGSISENQYVEYYENGRRKALGPVSESGTFPAGRDLNTGGYVYYSEQDLDTIYTPAGIGYSDDDPNSYLYSHLW